MSQAEERLRPLAERRDALIAGHYIAHGYVSDEGPDPTAILDRTYEVVSVAVVEKRADREKIAVTRAAMMEAVWPDVPGPGEWAEQADPEAAEAAYKRLDEDLWRLQRPAPSGPIQSRLNGGTGLLLCRTKATKGQAWATYVTHDLSALLADYVEPVKQRAKDAEMEFARAMALAADRVPEHGKRFLKEYESGAKLALNDGKEIIRPSLEEGDAS